MPRCEEVSRISTFTLTPLRCCCRSILLMVYTVCYYKRFVSFVSDPLFGKYLNLYICDSRLSRTVAWAMLSRIDSLTCVIPPPLPTPDDTRTPCFLIFFALCVWSSPSIRDYWYLKIYPPARALLEKSGIKQHAFRTFKVLHFSYRRSCVYILFFICQWVALYLI